MNWFAEQRQSWIAETLRVFGYINREHIMRKFGVSRPQASADIRQFRDRNPECVRYDGSTKRYVATDVFAEYGQKAVRQEMGR